MVRKVSAISRVGELSWTIENNWDQIRDGRDASDRVAINPSFLVPILSPVGQFTVFPNPSDGLINIIGPSQIYQVFDHTGALIGTYGSLAVLDEGVYLVATPGGAAVQRVVIVK